MSVKQNQNGFGIIEGLLVVIALTLIVGVGFYVKNSMSKSDDMLQTSQKSEEQTPAKQQAQQEYVEFKDLGFKIKKTDKMADWSYVNDPQVSMTKYVQSAAHVKKIDTCNNGGQNLPSDDSASSKSFAAFGRVDGTPKAEPDTVGGVFVKQLDGFYITIGYPNGGSPCYNEKGIGYPVERSPEGAQEALLEALKTAEKLWATLKD